MFTIALYLMLCQSVVNQIELFNYFFESCAGAQNNNPTMSTLKIKHNDKLAAMMMARSKTSSVTVRNRESKLFSSTSLTPLTSTEELYQWTRSWLALRAACKQLNKLFSSILFTWYGLYGVGMCVKLMQFLSDHKERMQVQNHEYVDGGGDELKQIPYWAFLTTTILDVIYLNICTAAVSVIGARIREVSLDSFASVLHFVSDESALAKISNGTTVTAFNATRQDMEDEDYNSNTAYNNSNNVGRRFGGNMTSGDFGGLSGMDKYDNRVCVNGRRLAHLLIMMVASREPSLELTAGTFFIIQKNVLLKLWSAVATYSLVIISWMKST